MRVYRQKEIADNKSGMSPTPKILHQPAPTITETPPPPPTNQKTTTTTIIAIAPIIVYRTLPIMRRLQITNQG